MKIVHLATTEGGGAGNAAYRLHTGLKKIGVDSKMLVAFKTTDDPSVIQILPEKYLGDPNELSWDFLSSEWNKILIEYPNYRKDLEIFTNTETKYSLENNAELQDADIVNLHWIAGFCDLNKNYEIFKNKKIVWTLHDLNSFTGGCHYSWGCKKYIDSCGECPLLGSNYEQDISRQIFNNKKQSYERLEINVVTPSRWLGQEASSSSLFKNNNVSVIPYGFPLDEFLPYHKNELKKGLGWDTNTKYVLFGAQSIENKRKGVKYFFEAVKHLESIIDENIVILFFGKMSSEIVFNSKYEFKGLGFVSDTETLAKAYSLADAFVIPSLEDNLPNTVIESFACGTPVVGFDIGGIPDMIDHKINGYVAKEKDTVDLAEGIKWVLENNVDEMLSINALKKTYEKYKLQTQASNYLNLYKKILNDRNKDYYLENSDKYQIPINKIEPIINNRSGVDLMNSNVNNESENMILNEDIEKAINDRDYTTAIAKLQEIINMDSTNTEALNNLAVVLSMLGDNDSAVRALNLVLKVDPDNEIAKENKAALNI